MVLTPRALGRTGLTVSPLGLGTVKFGRNQGVKYPTAFALPDDAQAAHLLDVAAELGITLLDTAPAYGSAEERLGGLLAGRRERWVLCTKAGEEFEDGRSRFDFSPKALAASLERSLKRLRTDRVEILLLHSDGEDLAHLQVDGALEALFRLKERGLARAVGISSKTLAGGQLAAHLADVVMVSYNPAYTDEAPVIAEAARRGCGVLVKKALNSGHLGASAADALRFCLGTEGVSSVVVGSLSEANLRANAAACGATA